MMQVAAHRAGNSRRCPTDTRMQPQSPVATLSPRHYLFQHRVPQLVDGLIHHLIELRPDQATLLPAIRWYFANKAPGSKVARTAGDRWGSICESFLPPVLNRYAPSPRGRPVARYPLLHGQSSAVLCASC